MKKPLKELSCVVVTFALIFVAATAPTMRSAGQDVAFQWPDSSHYWRVLVNVNQYIENYPKEWFSQDKLILDFAIRDIKPAERERVTQRFETLRSLLEARGMYTGTYVSGTTVSPKADQKTYPPASVSLEEMPTAARYVGSWPGQPNRRIIDVTDSDTRHGFQLGIRHLWESVPAPIRFVDNAAIHRSAGRGQPWAAYCENMEEIRKIGESLHSRVVFNISGHVGEFSDEEMRQLMRAVDNGGITLEMPWSPAIRQSKEATERAKAHYRQLLDTGMGVVMIPVNTPEDVLTDWVRTWRKASDHLYIGGSFWKAPNMKVYLIQ